MPRTNTVWLKSLVCALASVCTLQVYAADGYELRNLGLAIPGNATTGVNAINDLGDIAGEYTRGGGGIFGGYVVVNWTPFDLGSSTLLSINNAGSSVGTYFNGGLGGFRGFIFRNGQMTDLGLPQGVNHASDINNLNVIAGWIEQTGSVFRGIVRNPDGSYITIPNLGSTQVFPYAISDGGVVVGQIALNGTGLGTGRRPFVYENGQTTIVPGFTTESSAFDVNAAGDFTGTFRSNGGGYQPFVYVGGSRTDIAVPAAFDDGSGLSINNGGQVVGTYYKFVGNKITPFLWENGTVTLLESRLDETGAGWNLTTTRPSENAGWSINNLGQIAGRAIEPGAGQVAVLLSPFELIEPGTFAVQFGTVLAGGVGSLAAADGDVLRIQGGVNGSRTSAPIELTVDGTSPWSHPDNIQVTVTSRSLRLGVEQVLEMFNFESGSWLEVRRDALGASLGTVRFRLGDDVRRFISPGDQKMRLRVRVWPTQATSSRIETVEIDYVNFKVVL